MSLDLYPWQRQFWEEILEMRMRLGHAILLSAPEGFGLERLVKAIAAMAMCRNPQPPCEQCGDCRQAMAGEHCDLLRIGLQEKSSQIKVDQIRDLVNFMQKTPVTREGRRACIINPADAMNRNAANTLLKTLEEPPGAAFMLLVSCHPSRLPATIRSRSRKLSLGYADESLCLDWLCTSAGIERPMADELFSSAGRVPLRALEWHKNGTATQQKECFEACLAVLSDRADPMDLPAKWQAFGAQETMEWLLCWFAALLRCKIAGRPPYAWCGGRAAQELLGALGLSQLYQAHSRTLDVWRNLQHIANYSQQGLLEDLALFLYTLRNGSINEKS